MHGRRCLGYYPAHPPSSLHLQIPSPCFPYCGYCYLYYCQSHYDPLFHIYSVQWPHARWEVSSAQHTSESVYIPFPAPHLSPCLSGPFSFAKALSAAFVFLLFCCLFELCMTQTRQTAGFKLVRPLHFTLHSPGEPVSLPSLRLIFLCCQILF